MSVIKFPDTNLSIATKGKVGRPVGAGAYRVGFSWAGDTNPFAGVYQTRPRSTGRIAVKMRHYDNVNPQTEKQMAWRFYFSDVLAYWHNFDSDIRNKLNKSNYPRGMSGWNRFARKYMSRKPTDAGIMRAGLCSCGGLTI